MGLKIIFVTERWHPLIPKVYLGSRYGLKNLVHWSGTVNIWSEFADDSAPNSLLSGHDFLSSFDLCAVKASAVGHQHAD